MDKILFICEGEKTEKKFCDLIIDKYFLKKNKKKEYVAFGTNIYALYDELSKDESLDIIEIIKERAKLKNDIKTYKKLDEGGFAQVYLIFDFDFQALQYNDSKIKHMVKFFDNETEHGKLYINYPMIESVKHFKAIPDVNYNSYVVNRNQCLTYKRDVAVISAIIHFNDIDEDKLFKITKQNLDKYTYMSNLPLTDYEMYQNNFSQNRLLAFQLQHIVSNDNIYVINTALFWGIDYFGEKEYLKYCNDKILEHSN